MIIAIDGPAGAGKSTTASALAKYFNYAYIDTGAMYRAVALAASENGLRESDDEGIAALARALPLNFRENGQKLFIGDRDVSAEIRTANVSGLAASVSKLSGVREAIVAEQRHLARLGETATGGAVLEGRDIQTVVFPDAEIKIFLTADSATRITRRCAQWSAGSAPELATAAAADIQNRDTLDTERALSPLQPAHDAIHIATDHTTVEMVVEQIAAIVRAKQKELA